MLDLGFVRANLEDVKAKLRSRGEAAAALLNDFEAIDKERRAAITRVETLKAERNQLGAEVEIQATMQERAAMPKAI